MQTSWTCFPSRSGPLALLLSHDSASGGSCYLHGCKTGAIIVIEFNLPGTKDHTNTASVTLIVKESSITPASWVDLSEVITGVLDVLHAGWRGPKHSPEIQWSPCLVEMILTTEGKEPERRQQINCWPVCPPKSCSKT